MTYVIEFEWMEIINRKITNIINNSYVLSINVHNDNYVGNNRMDNNNFVSFAKWFNHY